MAELENEKHELFCQEYLVDLNGTQAAIRAGYKKRSAASTASTLLTNPNILARVGELRKEQRERLALNADFVVLEQNPFTVNASQLSGISLLQTFLGGRNVYKKS